MRYGLQEISVALPPRGTFLTLLADPPWWERGGGRIKRGADRHYPLMKTEEICDLRVPFEVRGRTTRVGRGPERYVSELCGDDAHLYLWVTNNHLLTSAPRVISAWGFCYVTCVTWFKTGNVGLGQYFRGVTEHCLFCVRGRLPYRTDPRTGRRAQGRTGFSAERGGHSVKPERLREYAELVSPGPRLELFARRRAPGWAAWGNEV